MDGKVESEKIKKQIKDCAKSLLDCYTENKMKITINVNKSQNSAKVNIELFD
jgi:hypothetical protein